MDITTLSHGMRVITFPREIPAGKPNPNTDKVITNLEVALREFVKDNRAWIPVDSVGERSGIRFSMFVEPSSVIGYLITVTDTEVAIALSPWGEKLYDDGLFSRASVQFTYLAEPDKLNKNALKVVKIIKPSMIMNLTPSHPEMNKKQGGICNEQREKDGGEDSRRNDQGPEGESLYEILEV